MIVILEYCERDRMPHNFTTANFGHQLSEIWLKPMVDPGVHSKWEWGGGGGF